MGNGRSSSVVFFVYKIWFSYTKKSLEQLSLALNKRAEILGIDKDEKFRNISGLNMQSACVQYVATNGEKGLSAASKLFYDVHDLHSEERDKFQKIVDEFVEKYGVFYD